MDIKPIETYYNGYKFRSRLEARWAVFFDACGISYQYEPEGITLSDGTWYLPDFYLPQIHCYFEVKRAGIEKTAECKEAIKKISDGARVDSWAGIIAFGDPLDNKMILFCQDYTESSGGPSDYAVAFGKDQNTGEIVLLADDESDRTYITSFSEPSYEIPVIGCGRNAKKVWPYLNKEMYEAELLARQARFEYGETPRIKSRG